MPVPGENVGGTVVKLLFKKGVLDTQMRLRKRSRCRVYGPSLWAWKVCCRRVRAIESKSKVLSAFGVGPPMSQAIPS